MIIYKVYTNFYDEGDDRVQQFFHLYANRASAEKDLYKRREKGDDAYLEEWEVITE